jgi:MoxR-like ATPase
LGCFLKNFLEKSPVHFHIFVPEKRQILKKFQILLQIRNFYKTEFVETNSFQNIKVIKLDISALNEKIRKESEFIDILFHEISKTIVGQKQMLERLVVGLLGNGHVLLEGVPGLAKTLAIKSLASSMKAKFQRIQFTPDLLPADLIGTLIYNQKESNFMIKKGPVFANFILADEINRAPAKVQSALLEAMQERQVTIGDQTYKLDEPFLVLATQNPIEQEGTYPLPEAQVDRFMLKVKITYPTREEEQKIMRLNTAAETPVINAVVTPDDILRARKLVHEIYVDEKIEKYILDIVFATRNPKEYGLDELTDLISYGASPRASINLALGARAMAFIRRRGYVIPEDVRSICSDILRHRIAVTYEAEAEDITSETIITKILNRVEVP